MITQDMHLHTKFSDGKNTIEEMAKAAIENNIKEICFTDHVRKHSNWWPMYFSECQRVSQIYASVLQISCGVETKICDYHGMLDLPEGLDPRLPRVAALHRLPNGNGEFISKDSLKQLGCLARTYWINAITGLQQNHEISRIAHPFSLLPYMDFPMDGEFWRQVSSIMDKGSYLIEYNLKYDNSFVPQAFWKHFSSRIVLGSDSHSVEALCNICQTNKEGVIYAIH